MEVNHQLLFFFSALGAFNGFLLSVYFFFFHRPKKLSNYFLGVLILALSLRIGKSVLLFFNPDLSKTILQIGLTACFFIGPALYFYLKSETENIQKISFQWKLIFIILTSIILLAGAIFPYPKYPEIWNQYYVRSIYWEWFIFMLASLFVLRHSFKNLFSNFSKITSNEKWWMGIYISNAFIFLAFFTSSHTSYILGALIFSFSIYTIAMIFLLEKKNKKVLSPTLTKKYSNKRIDDETANELLKKLKKVITEKEIFKNPNLKLKDLAAEIEIPAHQLSQLLNDNLGKNFALFINEYRIQAAQKILATNHQFSLEGIGQEVGFSSKSTFFATFKKMKGVTPSQFKNQL
ncbi:MAG: helix-turn-helix domain-containing protein [Saprospiraceae bacterium]